MRRIDVIAIGVGVFAAGGVIYLFFQAVGFDSLSAGIWSQGLFIAVLVGWILSYLLRVVSQNMTYNQQVKDYKEAVLQKRLEEMTPEELEKLQQEIEDAEQQ
ncbi:conserved hypothetical protein [Rippkaea orientalis PCC 8801]|uniref:DUF3007 family protein n=1 Tax=Rippkaea orientalis (strain PCC 8801 / RF-1) TaxID=41431 RepID=B7JUK1_RIPO1|nr:DUF3007 family protein [Rippkaea orientalis]ACK65545.1 conserved hypothetical protein [Rippkaea orientalis PCC 8801]